jgi:hypothetical protein
MKAEYDFGQAEQGNFYVPAESIQLPIFLDQDVQASLIQLVGYQGKVAVQSLVNKLLRKDIEMLDVLKTAA